MKIITGFFVFFIPLIMTGQPTWTQRMNFSGPARIQAVALSIGEKGYITTGTSGTPYSYFKDFQEYDAISNSWIFKSDVPMSLRGSSGFAIGKNVYLTVGQSPYNYNDVLYQWNQTTDIWSTKTSFPANYERIAALGFSIGGKGYIAAGQSVNLTPLNDLWEYDTLTDSWIQKANIPGGGKSYAASFVINGKAYVATGDNGNTYTTDLWEYNPVTNLWSQKLSLPGVGRAGAMGFTAGSKGYIVGGIDNNFNALSDVWEYNPVYNTWTQLANFPGLPRGYSSTFTINDVGYMAGGASINGNTTDVWELYPYAVGIEKRSTFNICLSPNPAYETISLSFQDSYLGFIIINLYDLSGRNIKALSCIKSTSDFFCTFDLSKINPGSYLLSLTNESGTLNINKLIIRK